MTSAVEFVPVGEYKVVKDQNIKLRTVVASCVALVLYDFPNCVTGMVHIVLPGRRSQLRPKDRAAYFADSGVPLLIREMILHGALKKNLYASVIGGGTLLAGIDDNDIGIRNVNAVLNILEKENIPVIKKDVGKEVGRRIYVNTFNGYIQVQSFKQGWDCNKITNSFPLSLDNFQNLLSNISNLKPNSTFAGKLLDLIHQDIDNIEWNKVKMTIARDISLSIHIFRIANSPYYGLPGKISSIESAFRLLGPLQFRRICVLASISRQSKSFICDKDMAKTILSQHSFASAIIARHMAKDMPVQVQENAFTAGLFHSIGTLGHMIAKDEDICRINYSRLGGMIISGLKMPEIITSAVISHELKKPDAVKYPSLAGLAHTGCAVSRMLGIINVLEPSTFKISTKLWDDISGIMPDIIHILKSNRLLDFFNIEDGVRT